MVFHNRLELPQLCGMQSRRRLTKRAPDEWESARFTSLFLTSGLYSPQAESTPRPLAAGNASRWLASLRKRKDRLINIEE